MKILILLSALFMGASAIADECPVVMRDDRYLDYVIHNIEAANSCWEAKNIAESCALGAGGDVGVVAVAMDVCERHMPKLSARELEMKNSMHERCNKKFEDMDGSMYRSATAFCHLSVQEMFVNLYSPAEF